MAGDDDWEDEEQEDEEWDDGEEEEGQEEAPEMGAERGLPDEEAEGAPGVPPVRGPIRNRYSRAEAAGAPEAYALALAQQRKEKYGKHQAFYRAEERRKKVIELIGDGMMVKDACAAVGITYATYTKWRMRFKDFGARADNAKVTGTKDRGLPSTGHGFAEFRYKYFQMESPWFHLATIHEYEKAKPGDVIMILFPPEHGKTTLYEDWACHQLSRDPEWMTMVASVRQRHAAKILGRVQARMNPNGRFKEWVQKFGPFMAPEGEDRNLIWTQNYFNVWRRGLTDGRDYNMEALGITSEAIGSRTNQLHLDDIQSRRGVRKDVSSEELFSVVTQDWMTRPGELMGFTSINGTRGGVRDFYGLMLDAYRNEKFFKLVKFPIVVRNQDTGELEPLWKERYTMDHVEQMRQKTTRGPGGDEVWHNTYLLDPKSNELNVFRVETLRRALNPNRAMWDTKDENLVISLDPNIGGGKNCFHVLAFGEKLKLIGTREDTNLYNNEAIMAILQELLFQVTANGSFVSEVVIESKFFQAGLARDERLLELAGQWGFQLTEHLTDMNKYDENVGVPSMITTFMKGEFDFPYTDQDVGTRLEVDELLKQFEAWRPFVKGNVLRQDRVMALWFAWIRWRQFKDQGSGNRNASAFQFRGLPWGMTRSGLAVPRLFDSKREKVRL